MTTTTGPQDPTVTPTFGNVGDEFIQELGGDNFNYFVKDAPSGTNTSWRLFGVTEATGGGSALLPGQYFVGPGGFDTYQEAIDQAVIDASEIPTRKTIIGAIITEEDLVIPPLGFTFKSATAGIALSGLFPLPARGIAACVGNHIIQGPLTLDNFIMEEALGGNITIDDSLVPDGSSISVIVQNGSRLGLQNPVLFNETHTFGGLLLTYVGSEVSPLEFVFNSASNAINISNCSMLNGTLDLNGGGGSCSVNCRSSSLADILFENGIFGEFYDSVLRDVVMLSSQAIMNDCNIRGSGTLPQDLEVDDGAFVFLRSCFVGNINGAANARKVRIGQGVLVVARSQLAAGTGSALFMDDPSAQCFAFDAVLASDGPARAIDGTFAGQIILGQALFTVDNRINPLFSGVTFVTSGTAIASAGDGSTLATSGTIAFT